MQEMASLKCEGRLEGKSESELEEMAAGLLAKNRAKDFEIYFEAQYGETIAREYAESFVRLAKKHPQLREKEQAAFVFYDDPNLIRSGLLALQVFPAKQHAEMAGDASVPRLAPHLAIINRFEAMLRELEDDKRTAAASSAIITDFEPVAQHLAQFLANERATSGATNRERES